MCLSAGFKIIWTHIPFNCTEHRAKWSRGNIEKGWSFREGFISTNSVSSTWEEGEFPVPPSLHDYLQNSVWALHLPLLMGGWFRDSQKSSLELQEECPRADQFPRYLFSEFPSFSLAYSFNKYLLNLMCQAIVGPKDTLMTKARRLLWPFGASNKVGETMRSKESSL